jgi:hypothetical protein
MNQIQETVLGVFAILFSVVVFIIAVPYFAPVAGSASSGIVSTGTTFTNALPFLGLMVIGGIGLMAMEMRRKK